METIADEARRPANAYPTDGERRMTKAASAGVLRYRIRAEIVEVLLVHPGGPYWQKKDAGVWSIPKGEFEVGDDALTTAQREFYEETGSQVTGKFVPLTPLKQPSGKLVHCAPQLFNCRVSHYQRQAKHDWPWHDRRVIALADLLVQLLGDLVVLVFLVARPTRSLAAENLLLRRQLALYLERGTKPPRIDAATRITLAWLSRLCDWRSTLVVVRPQTVTRWHRAGWRLLWRYKSRPGRPPIPHELRHLIRRMANENPVGRRTDRQRVADQARCPALATNRPEIHAQATFGSPTRRAALGNLSQEPRTSDCRCDCKLSAALCLYRHPP